MDEADIANEYLARRWKAWEDDRGKRDHLSPEDGPTHCVECGELIPQARRNAQPGCVLCVQCQQEHDDG